jgi:hypothetical protein
MSLIAMFVGVAAERPRAMGRLRLFRHERENLDGGSMADSQYRDDPALWLEASAAAS